MPNYDLRCTHCDNEFTAKASISERTEKQIACPVCGSCELDAVFKSVRFQVGKGAAAECPNRGACGSGSCPME